MNNIKNFKIFYILLFFSLVYLSNIIFSNELDTFKLQVGWYQESLYRLNYFDFGFIKRGLVGSIIYPFKSHYKLSIFLISLLVCVLIIYYFVEITFNEKLKEIKNYLILFSISPFFFQFLGYDFGRLDQWGILFLLITTYFIVHRRDILILELLAPFLILITEVLLFTSISFFVLIQILAQRPKKNIFYTLSISVFLFFIILFFGNLDKNTIETYKHIYAIDVYFSRGQIETSLYFWKLIIDFKHSGIYRHLISIFVYLIITFYLIIHSKNNLFLICISLAYFALFIFGIDHARFLSIFLINNVFIFLIIFINNPQFQIKLPRLNKFHFLIFLIGPWGIGKALPVLTVIKKFISE